MSAKGAKSLFKVGIDILGVEVHPERRTVLLQLGDATAAPSEGEEGANVEYTEEAELWGPPGYIGLPCPVTPPSEDAAQAVTIARSDGDIVIGTRDCRYQELIGNLLPGEVCIYAPGLGQGQARQLFKQDGSVSLFTKRGNTAGGVGMGIFVTATDGSIKIVAPGKSGAVFDDDGVKVFTEDGALQITSAAFKISSTAKVVISAPGVTIGSASALPVLTAQDLTALIPLIATGISGAGPGGPAAAGVFTTAANLILSALPASRRTWAD